MNQQGIARLRSKARQAHDQRNVGIVSWEPARRVFISKGVCTFRIQLQSYSLLRGGCTGSHKKGNCRSKSGLDDTNTRAKNLNAHCRFPLRLLNQALKRTPMAAQKMIGLACKFDW